MTMTSDAAHSNAVKFHFHTALTEAVLYTKQTDPDVVSLHAAEALQMSLGTTISENAVELCVSTKHQHCNLT